MPPTDKKPLSLNWSRFRFGLLAWAVALVCGFGWIISYQMRAGTPANAPREWPDAVGLPFDAHRYNLVMFAHPKCPCTAASLEELKVVLTQGRGEIKSSICFIEPEGVPGDWAQTRLVREARSIPGLNVVMDPTGAITTKFGAMTSGQVLLFDDHGHRVFSGGITAARGHQGDNRGRTLVLTLANGGTCDLPQTPVFGCALHDAASPEEAKP